MVLVPTKAQVERETAQMNRYLDRVGRGHQVAKTLNQRGHLAVMLAPLTRAYFFIALYFCDTLLALMRFSVSLACSH